ncbi:hypothetical protein BC936DRAFT_149810 [Jimgerdemannia flammicorona]|uniref:Uncharacterized protein n=2 Tax=Jimgerdemannia flammicorona TaxID=994334 RepID=A0A433D036_9FUNG|nr:hypothetical protein BC936DRAFT_149810 [Jimgerdemannia flammicorona]RUS29438.1 hypothetical protein BC938DRAFT_480665 [Jimgerdemannia flammicorona]
MKFVTLIAIVVLAFMATAAAHPKQSKFEHGCKKFKKFRAEHERDDNDCRDDRPVISKPARCVKVHIVDRNDRIARIAMRYRISLQQLILWNPRLHANGDNLVVGLPVCVEYK